MIALAYKSFNLFNYNTWLAPFVRLFTYFLGRGKYDSVKWHHCIGVSKNEVIEAVASGVWKKEKSRLLWYDKTVVLDFNFEIDRVAYWEILNSLVGVKYNYYLVFVVKAWYQMTGRWISNFDYKKMDCTYLIGVAIYHSCLDNNVRSKFANPERLDAQDFVRMWKVDNLFKKI